MIIHSMHGNLIYVFYKSKKLWYYTYDDDDGTVYRRDSKECERRIEDKIWRI
jgi:hypothetical protein